MSLYLCSSLISLEYCSENEQGMNLQSSGFAKGSCAVVITATLRFQKQLHLGAKWGSNLLHTMNM